MQSNRHLHEPIGSHDFGVAEESLLFTEAKRHAEKHRIGLPWESFADSWSLAEEQLARLEQQLSSSNLKHSWICRADFEEASAVAMSQGCEIPMEELVLSDANSIPLAPQAAWLRAKAFLSLRRHISRAGPERTLTSDGLLALEERANEILDGRVAEHAQDDVSGLEHSRHRIELWLDAVHQLRTTPPLPAMAIALRVWRQLRPLRSHNEEIGLILASLLLWHWRKTKGLTLCLGVGLRSSQLALDDDAMLGAWIRRVCDLVQAAGAWGQSNHRALVAAHNRLIAVQSTRRATSRLPRLSCLFLNYPALSLPFIEARLGVTNRGARWLVGELVRDGVVQELPREGSRRAYALAHLKSNINFSQLSQ